MISLTEAWGKTREDRRSEAIDSACRFLYERLRNDTTYDPKSAEVREFNSAVRRFCALRGLDPRSSWDPSLDDAFRSFCSSAQHLPPKHVRFLDPNPSPSPTPSLPPIATLEPTTPSPIVLVPASPSPPTPNSYNSSFPLLGG